MVNMDLEALRLEDSKVLVAGAGVSGIAATELLLDKGIDVMMYDGKADLDVEALYARTPRLRDVPLLLGDLTEEQLRGFGVAVLSPGIPTDLPVVERMRACGLAIWGEIELAYYFARGRLAAITGTNGKTTTTALTGEIMRMHFRDVRVVGNIGIPYTQEAGHMTDETVTVAEISSFQLETIHAFHPQTAAILNITPDHLNRHHSMENYIAAKEDIVRNHTKEDVVVLNYEDEVLREFGESLDCNVVYFSSARILDNGYYLDGEEIYRAKEGSRELLVNIHEVQILGVHNYENIMAASAIAESFGVEIEEIRQALRSFTAVEHRIEFTVERDGVRYYNDSKATNTDAAIKGICAMNRPTYLIGGGYDKQSEYDDWIDSFGGKVKCLVLFGATAGKIEECAHRHGFTDTVHVSDLKEAVAYCRAHAVDGDAVLLSPACASWDMFPNYEVRGRQFKELARTL